MKKVKLCAMVMLFSVGFYSCTSIKRGDFSKIKYLDKHVAKKQSLDNKKSDRYYYEEIVDDKINIENEYTEASLNEKLVPKIELRNMEIIPKKMEINSLSVAEVNAGTEKIYIELSSKSDKKNKSHTKPVIVDKSQEVDTLIKVILSVLLPPLAVFLHEGLGNRFWISLILTLLVWVPGVVFALLVVLDVI